MLDYPLPLPRGTHYDALELAPEATPDEIQVAARELKASLKKQKDALDRQIDDAEASIPGLKDARRKVDALRNNSAQAIPDALTKAQAELARLEQQARAKYPNLDQMRERSAELGERHRAINRMNVENADQRLAYDRAHPPLELLKIESVADEAFSGNKFPLPLLREVLSEFLAGHGEDVAHPSDLTRKDFSDDFTYNQLLDGTPTSGG